MQSERNAVRDGLVIEAGRDAHNQGQKVKDNPHERGTMECILWCAGWTEAFYKESGKAGRGKSYDKDR